MESSQMSQFCPSLHYSQPWALKNFQIQCIPYAHTDITDIHAILSSHWEERNILPDFQQKKLLSSPCFYYTPYSQPFFPSKKKLSPFSYENPILSSRLGYPSSFRFLWDSGTLSSPQLSTGSPVLSQQPHFKFFQLIVSQTRTSSLHSAREAQNVFFTTSGLVRSSVSCMRDPTRSSSEVYKRWAVITSPRAHTRIRGNARI